MLAKGIRIFTLYTRIVSEYFWPLVNYIKLETNAILAQKFALDSSVEVVYIVSGGGRVEIVDMNGQLF